MTDPKFQEALQRLDAEIEQAEARLADLRLKRQGAEVFLAYMSELPAGTVRMVGSGAVGAATMFSGEGTLSAGPATSQGITGDVEKVLRERPGQAMTLREVTEHLDTRATYSRAQLRNALHYLRRKTVIDSPGRGLYRLPNADEPADTGSSGETPSDREGVDASGAVPDRDHDEDSSRQADHRVFDHRAPVGG